MDLLLEPKKIFKLFLFIVFCLTLAHIGLRFSVHYFGNGFGLVELFDLEGEGNIPTVFSYTGLLLCCAIFSFIAFTKHKIGGRYSLHWAGLAAIFLFLALDEAVMIHERLSARLHFLLDTSGFLYFAWIIPYGALMIFLPVAYWRFLKHLPARWRILFLTAGAIYGNAIGVEAFKGFHADVYGRDNFTFATLVTVQEVIELLATTFLIYTLMTYVRFECGKLQIKFEIDTEQVQELGASKEIVERGFAANQTVSG